MWRGTWVGEEVDLVGEEVVWRWTWVGEEVDPGG